MYYIFKHNMPATVILQKEDKVFSAPTVIFGSSFEVVEPVTKQMVYKVTLQFTSKEEADDFLEEIECSKNPEFLPRFRQAEKESKEGKAKPMNNLFEKYGV